MVPKNYLYGFRHNIYHQDLFIVDLLPLRCLLMRLVDVQEKMTRLLPTTRTPQGALNDNVNDKCHTLIMCSGVEINWFICERSSLNMEQVQVKSIGAMCLVFWMMSGGTGMRKYFPPSAAAFYWKEKLHKITGCRRWPPSFIRLSHRTHIISSESLLGAFMFYLPSGGGFKA